MKFFTALTYILIGLFLGNWDGDQGTLRKCAVDNRAVMVGGGTIECTVVKEQP
jgi:hypothetical protein